MSSSATEPIGGGGGSSSHNDAKSQVSSGSSRNLVNANLLSLKCLLFFFFGAIGCLVPFLPLHMLSIGLTLPEIQIVSVVSPLVAMLGPLIAGPLADRMARRKLNSDKHSQTCNVNSQNVGNGRYLRVMIAVCLVFSALLYSMLLVVPSVRRIELPQELRPDVKFSCDANSAVVHQERCRDSIGCHQWSNEEFMGRLHLQRCRYACYPSDEKRVRAKYPPAQAESLGPSDVVVTTMEPLLQDEAAVDPYEDESSGEDLGVIPLESDRTTSTTTEAGFPRDARNQNSRSSLPEVQLPHVCYTDDRGRKVCHVFEDYGHGLSVNVSLRQALNPEDTNDWCSYPVAQPFSCRIPGSLESKMSKTKQTCQVECQLENPYDSDFGEDSVLAESQCRQVIGNEQLTFWMYLGFRCLADIFPTAAIALIDAAVVIATRETSTGRGDVGRQLAFGALGMSVFGPLAGYLVTVLKSSDLPMSFDYAPLILHALLMCLSACIALGANAMPLGPPEWWWHTRSGMLALPMSAVRKYGGETVALFLVLVLLGGFWSIMDSYLPIHLVNLKGDELSIGVAVTVGALLAVLFLWKSEHLVDYCGHSNLLITAFIMYILRFTGLSLVPDAWWALLPEALELFTLEIMWVTAILYFRHLIPRQMTATGQALPVIAHFCIGRAIGAFVGAYMDKLDRSDEVEAMRYVYQWSAVAAAVIATLYFLLYHTVLKPRCHAQTPQAGHRQPPSIVQAMNGNGNYTPLRVYHNGMGRKGEFRY